ncbi:MAG: hypothetical protein FJX77_04810 [Armatimonadetes bacterium]|nr:hypothetical protein [Armatimonadota bacterium]
MAVVLQFLGVLFLILLAVLVGGILFLRVFIRRKTRHFLEALEGVEESDFAVIQPRLHLAMDSDISWLEGERFAGWAAGLETLGFTDAGMYHVREIPRLHLRGWVQTTTSVIAVVYEHPEVGLWFDLVARYRDGRIVTFTNTMRGDELNRQETRFIVRDREGDPASMYARLLQERPEGELKPAAAATFVADFERAYAEEMDWRNSQGQISEEELLRSAAQSGQAVTPENLAALREHYRSQANHGLEIAFRERLFDEISISARDWEEVRERLIFIHDNLSLAEVLEIFQAWSPEEDEEEDTEALLRRLEFAGSARAAFATLAARAPGDQVYRKLGELKGPVPADVWAAPESTEFCDEDDDE